MDAPGLGGADVHPCDEAALNRRGPALRRGPFVAGPEKAGGPGRPAGLGGLPVLSGDIRKLGTVGAGGFLLHHDTRLLGAAALWGKMDPLGAAVRPCGDLQATDAGFCAHVYLLRRETQKMGGPWRGHSMRHRGGAAGGRTLHQKL